jgi:O-antigen/teichoic acid export membrane protein
MSRSATILRNHLNNALDRRSITGNIVQLLFGSGIGQIFIAIATLLATRTLGDAAYGQYAAAYTIATLTSTAFNFGMDNWLLQQARLRESLPHFTANSLLARFGLGIVWLIALTFIAPRLNNDTFLPELVFLIGISVWFDGMISACNTFFKATLSNRTTALWLMLNTGGLLFAFYLLAEQNAPVTHFAWARLGVTGIVLTGLVAWLLYSARIHLQMVWVPAMFRASIPFALSDFFYLVYMRSDVAIIGIQLDSRAVGQYAPASMLISALFLIPSSLYMVMVPVLSRRIHALQQAPTVEKVSHQDALHQQLKKLFFAATGIGITLTLGTFLLGPLIVDVLLPPAYDTTAAILRILSWLLFFKTGSFALGALLVAADLQTSRVRWQAVVAIISATVTYLLARSYGITAVAWLYVLTEALLFAGYFVLSVRWFQRRTV